MIASINQLSDMTGKSYRTIKKHLAESGLDPMKVDDRSINFESKDALPILYGIAHNADKLNLEQERAKLAQEQHRKLTRENDVEEKKVAPVSLLTDVLEKSASKIIPILESLPLEMKRMNPKLTGQDIHLVKKSIAVCRNAIADMEIEV